MNQSEIPSPAIERVEFPPVPEPPDQPSGAATVRMDAPFLSDIKVSLEARLGAAQITVKELLALQPGSLVTLSERLGDMVELKLNATTIAKGEIVAVGDQFGVRIVEISEHR